MLFPSPVYILLIRITRSSSVLDVYYYSIGLIVVFVFFSNSRILHYISNKSLFEELNISVFSRLLVISYLQYCCKLKCVPFIYQNQNCCHVFTVYRMFILICFVSHVFICERISRPGMVNMLPHHRFTLVWIFRISFPCDKSEDLLCI